MWPPKSTWGSVFSAVPKKAAEKLSQFNIRMPDTLIAMLDAEVDEQRRLFPGRMYTRSDLIRDVLFAHVGKRAKPKLTPPPRRG
jgi:hypothetical protein